MIIIFQKVDPNGEVFTKHINWPEDGPDMFEELDRSVDRVASDAIIFLVEDLYSDHKERKI